MRVARLFAVVQTDLDVGIIILQESLYPVSNVVASANTANSSVVLTWNTPVAFDYHFSDFEDNNGGWKQQLTGVNQEIGSGLTAMLLTGTEELMTEKCLLTESISIV